MDSPLCTSVISWKSTSLQDSYDHHLATCYRSRGPGHLDMVTVHFQCMHIKSGTGYHYPLDNLVLSLVLNHVSKPTF